MNALFHTVRDLAAGMVIAAAVIALVGFVCRILDFLDRRRIARFQAAVAKRRTRIAEELAAKERRAEPIKFYGRLSAESFVHHDGKKRIGL